MKKITAVLLILLCFTSLAGCSSTSSKDVYSFPEPTKEIRVVKASEGEETEFVIGSENYDAKDLSVIPVMEWFYGLDLKECERPESVEGSECYTFTVDGQSAFTYENRGDKAHIIVDSKWYEVKNPSVPPIE